MDQGGFFAADERAGAHLDDHFEGEVGTEDVLAQQVVRFRFGDGDLQTGNGQRILGTDVDVGFLSADGVCGQRHPFEETVRVAFDDRAVHERARVAFVGVADQVAVRLFVGAGKHPFAPGGEPAAAASAQAAVENLFTDVVGRDFVFEGLFQSAVTAAGDILFETAGVHQTAVRQHPAGLRGEEGMFVNEDDAVPGGGLFVPVLAHHVLGNRFALIDGGVENGGNRVFRHLLERNAVFPRKLDIDDRFDGAKTDAPDLDDVGIQIVFFYKGFDGFKRVGRAGAKPAGACSDVEGRFQDVFPAEDRKLFRLFRRQFAFVAQGPGEKFTVKRFHLFHFVSILNWIGCVLN